MKLKLVVASMSILGLISCPAFAAHKHKHHYHHHYHHTSMHHAERMDNQQDTMMTTHTYKDMGALPVAVCPIMDPNTLVLDSMSQNTGRAKPNEDCMKMISFAGGANFDAGWGNRSDGYMGENSSRVSLNDVYLNVYGNVSDWTKAFASISYNDASGIFDNGGSRWGQYSHATPPGLRLEQGFVRISNFEQTPFFIQLGKQFQPYGRYAIHPIMRSMTQVMTESLHTSGEVGFLANGFHAAIFAFDNSLAERRMDSVSSSTLGHHEANYGAELGYAQVSDQLGFDLGVGYMYNMIGVNDVAAAVSMFSWNGFKDRVGAASVHGNVNSGPFSVGVRYTTALDHFNVNDLSNRTLAAVWSTGVTRGAEPWAADITGGFNFNAFDRNQNLYVGYQQSGDAVNIFLPQKRWVAGYMVDAWRATNVGIEFAHDTDYGVSRGGCGNSSNKVNARVAVKFG